MKKYIHLNQAGAFFRSKMAALLAGVLGLVVVTGCNSVKVTDRVEPGPGKVPRPNTVWVYDFASTPAEIPNQSTLAGLPDLETAAQTPEDTAEGEKLGHDMAAQLVTEIQDSGMTAQLANPGTQPQLNDLVIRGYLLSVVEGSSTKRVMIGFGAGASELKVAVEGFRMTATGLRKIGSGNAQLGGGKSPGAAVGAVGFVATHNPAGLIISSGMRLYGEASGNNKVEGKAKEIVQKIGDVLRKKFRQQGWID